MNDFKRTIETIRTASVSCSVTIPAPPAGRTFDKGKVSVKYKQVALRYDADCKAADSSWHCDDVNAPREIVLCPQTCMIVQSDMQAELAVDFECEQVIPF